MLNGMLWILRRIVRTGAPWEDLPARYGAAGTVSSRFYRRREAGVSDRVLQRPQALADARGAVDRPVARPPVRRRGTPVQRHREVTARSRSATRRSRAVRAASPPRSGLPTPSTWSPSP